MKNFYCSSWQRYGKRGIVQGEYCSVICVLNQFRVKDATLNDCPLYILTLFYFQTEDIK